MGNALAKEYNVKDQCASGGPSFLWKVYPATKKNTGEEVSIFLFEKESIKKEPKSVQEAVLAHLRREASTLARLRHPHVLQLLAPVVDNKGILAMVTEPVAMSLANAVGDVQGIKNVPPALHQQSLSGQEIKCGLQQLSEALAFVHKDAGTVHSNLSLSSVYITPKGIWKLAGFNYSLEVGGEPLAAVGEVTSSGVEVGPSLDYTAPELIDGNVRPSQASDLFGLGCLASAVHGGRMSVMRSNGSVHTYRHHLDEIQDSLSDERFAIPPALRDGLKALLAVNPAMRMTTEEFLNCAYFNDVVTRVIRFLDNMMDKDAAAKIKFFKALLAILPQVEEKMLRIKVLPNLLREVKNEDVAPHLMPNLMWVVTRVDAPRDEFAAEIYPALRPMIVSGTPLTCVGILLKDIDLVAERVSKDTMASDIVPMLVKVLGDDGAASPDVQRLALNAVAKLAETVEYMALKTKLLPAAQQLALASPSTIVRVDCLRVMSKIFHKFDQPTILESIMPHLVACVRADASAPILMAVLGVQSAIAKTLPIKIVAVKTLPFLMPLTVAPALNRQQFETYTTVVRSLVDRIEAERVKAFDASAAMNKEAASAVGEQDDAAGGDDDWDADAKTIAARQAASRKVEAVAAGDPATKLDVQARIDGRDAGMGGGAYAAPTLVAAKQPAKLDAGEMDMFSGLSGSWNAPAAAAPAASAPPAAVPGGDMFAGMAVKTDATGGDMFSGMSVKTDATGGSTGSSASAYQPPAAYAPPVSAGGGDMFGGLAVKSEPAAATGGNMFGGLAMKSEPAAAPAPAGGDLFAGMTQRPAAPSSGSNFDFIGGGTGYAQPVPAQSNDPFGILAPPPPGPGAPPRTSSTSAFDDLLG